MKLVGWVMSTCDQYFGTICVVITEHIASNLKTLQLNFACVNEWNQICLHEKTYLNHLLGSLNREPT
jgi:hypothetical protein